MYPRTKYEMTEEDLKELLEACKSVPMIALQCGPPSSPQENANNAWKALGNKMGFDHMTVEPEHGKGYRFFSAVPNENEKAKKERLEREKAETQQKEIKNIQEEINNLEIRLARALEE